METVPFSLLFVFGLANVAFQVVVGKTQEDDLPQAFLHQNERSVHRTRRTVLTDADAYEAVSIHNLLRSMEGSSDMQSLRWNGLLASMADAWAQQCQWYHGQAVPTPPELGYPSVGQNLYAVSGLSTINITSAVLEWYNEKTYYNYDTLACSGIASCGHYTEVVWAKAYEVGCAIKQCASLNQSTLVNPLYLVCNYGPAGNIINQKPFQKGPACSQCSTGQFWCTQNLCNRTCAMNPAPNCACVANCKNNATFVSSNCSCQCADGWNGNDCSAICANQDSKCDPAPGIAGYPPSYCDNAQYKDIIRPLCPLMCGVCKGAASNCLLEKLFITLMFSTILSILLGAFDLRH